MDQAFSSKKSTLYEEAKTDKLNDDLKSGKARAIVVYDHGFRRDVIRFTGFPYMFQELAKFSMTQEEYRLLFYCLGHMSLENWVHISQQEMGDDLGMQKQNVYRALKGLSEKGVIAVQKAGRNNYYRVNPEIAWRGSAQKWGDVVDLKEVRKKQGMGIKTPF